MSRKGYSEIVVSRQEAEHLLHCLKVYGHTNCYYGIERLFRRRQGLLESKLSGAISSCAPPAPSRPHRLRNMRKRVVRHSLINAMEGP